jgi:hypothetical protein
MGSGKGHDLQVFYEPFGAECGDTLLLEGLRGVIEGTRDGALDKEVINMGHNFFQTQPIKDKNHPIAFILMIKN